MESKLSKKSKAQLREYFKSIKKNLPDDQKRLMDQKIIKNILNLKEYNLASVILAYMANDIEVNLDDFISFSISNDKNVALPKCFGPDFKNMMDFYLIDNMNDFIIGNFNIREPKSFQNKITQPFINDNFTIMFLPGLAFDFFGFRLGYGKGFYDRYLQSHVNILKIGLVYDFALLDELIHDVYDIPVDILISDSNIIKLH